MAREWPLHRLVDRGRATYPGVYTMTLDQIEVANLLLDALDDAQAAAEPAGAP